MVTEHAEPGCQLDVPKGLTHPVVDIDVEAKLLAVEPLCPIDIGHLDNHNLEAYRAGSDEPCALQEVRESPAGRRTRAGA
jgi:hypothetical protein